MQASKIIPGTIYAARVANNTVRFKVSGVTTTQHRSSRRSPSPHDYKSAVEGHIEPGDRITEADADMITIAPEAVIGPFQEYQELKDKEAAEKKIADEIEAKNSANVKALRLKFYQVTGIEAPQKFDDWEQPFAIRYGTSMTISTAGVEALLKALSK